MVKRTRDIQVIFYVNKAELNFITRKMQLLGLKNRSAYLRRIAVNGYIIHVDHAYLKEHTRQIRLIGININQIAHHFNATGKISRHEIIEIKKLLEEVWRLQRSILLKQP